MENSKKINKLNANSGTVQKRQEAQVYRFTCGTAFTENLDWQTQSNMRLCAGSGISKHIPGRSNVPTGESDILE